MASIKDVRQQVLNKFDFTDTSLLNSATKSVVNRVIIDSFSLLSEEDQDYIDKFLNDRLADYKFVIENAIDELEKYIVESSRS
ncbi:MAG: hypothetical protein D3925_01965 [Candidatus Electrothrix sp. AR5]|nr:hypothetical protein [Candidatus Electrothrix sp. AR5]